MNEFLDIRLALKYLFNKAYVNSRFTMTYTTYLGKVLISMIFSTIQNI